MRIVMKMPQFIRAVQTGDWKLHHQFIQDFTKYFFAYDVLNYARTIPLYLAEMNCLPTTDPDVYGESLSGNWVVNRTLAYHSVRLVQIMDSNMSIDESNRGAGWNHA